MRILCIDGMVWGSLGILSFAVSGFKFSFEIPGVFFRCGAFYDSVSRGDRERFVDF
jgi:hypothetical protein